MQQICKLPHILIIEDEIITHNNLKMFSKKKAISVDKAIDEYRKVQYII